MSVDPNHHVPIYEQIVEHICGSVTAGVFRPGEVLPSIRALAIELVVNPNTVQRAYQELERIGLVQMRKGLGAFVTSNGKTSARARTEAAVRDRFAQGIRVGRSAQIDGDRLKTIFSNVLSTDPHVETSPENRSPTDTRSDT